MNRQKASVHQNTSPRSRRREESVASEDEKGVWLEEDGEPLFSTGSDLRLPRFNESKHSSPLRIHYHEVLINITDGKTCAGLPCLPEALYLDAP
jgi:hypothetical protein